MAVERNGERISFAKIPTDADNAASLGFRRRRGCLGSRHFKLAIPGELTTEAEFTTQSEHWLEQIWRDDFALVGFGPFQAFSGVSVEPQRTDTFASTVREWTFVTGDLVRDCPTIESCVETSLSSCSAS